MKISSVEFVISSPNIDKCPKPIFPEYAFIGRSNVGKSSLINMLMERRHLAKTSSTPGKTQLINHFLVNKATKPWYLVDLPGFGYARVPKKIAENWMGMIKGYLANRDTLMCVLMLIDVRHAPQKNDLEFMEWMGEKGIPFVMVFTKLDKLTPAKAEEAMTTYKTEMLKVWESLPEIFVTSSANNSGREEILNFIDSVNEKY
ncbi:MAG: YihA family ribosome biogenesis GTP-binding protein [Flavobacteriales bacterium]|nr:YihA family ribosome biogenesis GTP-binding protein [Flavobacteriales bacterium]